MNLNDLFRNGFEGIVVQTESFEREERAEDAWKFHEAVAREI